MTKQNQEAMRNAVTNGDGKNVKSKAPSELLNLLHGLIANDMRRKLENGECEAKDWAVIVKFLKDNGIDAVIDDSMSSLEAFNQLVAAGQKSIEEQMMLH